jgi:hypothetical protein
LDESRNVFDSVCPPGDDTDGGAAAVKFGAALADDPMIAELTFATFDQLAELTGLDASGLGASFLHGAYSVSPEAVAAALAADFGPQRACGAENDTGGAENGTGGAENGTGGAENGTGGAENGTGGAENGTGGADPCGGRRGGAAAAVLRTSEAEMQALLDLAPPPVLASDEGAGSSTPSDDGPKKAFAASPLRELGPSQAAGQEPYSRSAHNRLSADALHTAALHTAAVHTTGECEDMHDGGAAASAGAGGPSAKRPLACNVASRSVLARIVA